MFPKTTGLGGSAIEIDPLYCDVIVRRMARVCGIDAVIEARGQSFAEVEAERLEGQDPLEAAA